MGLKISATPLCSSFFSEKGSTCFPQNTKNGRSGPEILPDNLSKPKPLRRSMGSVQMIGIGEKFMRIVALIVAFLLPDAAIAATATLKFTDQSGQPVADLQVNVVAAEMRWSINSYRITQQDERYISATEITKADRVGGEVWVLDRVTGQYTRAAVAILATEFANGRPIDPRLQAAIYSGTCKAPIL
ncbi:hypothetical protein [Lysobacter sp. CA196]|uniref:hypothetical protein n=1 Tax=Lysobacter sp. CA196 TaxID=3455606 RepID=UPI003F8D0307